MLSVDTSPGPMSPVDAGAGRRRRWHPRLSGPPRPQTTRHVLGEDAFALLSGAFLVGLGLLLFDKAQVTIGGSAGLALVLHFATGMAFWKIFAIANIPFYLFAFRRMGPGFAVRTFAAVGLVSAFTALPPTVIDIGHVDATFATLGGGLLSGMGLLALFRHRTAVGGLNIIALHMQEAYGIRAGVVQMCLDLIILTSAAIVLSPRHAALSVLGSLVTNAVLTINHKPWRYVGTTPRSP